MGEFLKQSNRIRKELSAYLKKTKVLDIRKVMPDVSDCKTEEEKLERYQAQSKENISNMLDAMLEENTDDTVRILGLLCFKEGDEVNDLSPADVLSVLLEVLSNKRTLDFFTSLMQSGLIDTGVTLQK